MTISNRRGVAILGILIFALVVYALIQLAEGISHAMPFILIGIAVLLGLFCLIGYLDYKRVKNQNKAREDLMNEYGHLGIAEITNSGELSMDKKLDLLRDLIRKHNFTTAKEIIFLKEIDDNSKIFLLTNFYGYSIDDANFVIRNRQLSADEIVLLKDLSPYAKTVLLTNVHGYSSEEATHLMETAVKEEQRARLKGIKRKITQKAMEQYGDVPTDDRQPIPDDVKTFVWQRDRGRCVKCGGNEKLEFDHVIPFSKGGSNTERNLQLLCEKCNREKSNNI